MLPGECDVKIFAEKYVDRLDLKKKSEGPVGPSEMFYPVSTAFVQWGEVEDGSASLVGDPG
ncbi:MAG: hypothetical protein JXA22_07340 [Candidatus Thermoplasmatota archaeon]|nr:hypothetical protein [Candidatus Thermoplasmatota archaeon]